MGKTFAGRIIVIVSLIVFFIVLYTVVGVAYDKDEVTFGYWVNMTPEDEYINFVILGTDKGETRTDLILLCSFSESENTLDIVQIPRDTRVETDRADKKINSAYGSRGGIEEIKAEVEQITGVYPDKYVVLNFDGFRQLIDAIGGVEFNVPFRMYYTDPVQDLVIDLYPGKQVLNGEKAEMFMRFRQNNDGTGYVEGDIGRLKAQKNFYKATVKQILSLNGLINLGEIMNTVGNNLKTDFTLSDLLSHIDNLRRLGPDSINIVMLPGRSGYINENGNNISYYIRDEKETEKLIREYFKFTK